MRETVIRPPVPMADPVVPARGITGDELLLIREAVAGMQEACGLVGLAERTLSGELDQQPVMQCAIAAVENVKRGRMS